MTPQYFAKKALKTDVFKAFLMKIKIKNFELQILSNSKPVTQHSKYWGVLKFLIALRICRRCFKRRILNQIPNDQ